MLSKLQSNKLIQFVKVFLPHLHFLSLLAYQSTEDVVFFFFTHSLQLFQHIVLFVICLVIPQ